MHCLRLLLVAMPLFAFPHTAVCGGDEVSQQLAQFQMPPDRPNSPPRLPVERPQPPAERVFIPPGSALPPRLPSPRPSPVGPQ
jgi:hypothetical protein